MSTHLHVRDLPDHVHEVLRARARRSGRSLRQYTIDVLAAHCAWPTIDEWLTPVRIGRRLGDLPDLLASLPSLGDDAADFADDVDRAR